MKIEKNSKLGWLIHLAYSALMGWFVGYMLIPGVLALVFALVLGTIVKVVIGAAAFALYLYALRSGFDLANPFKNGGWL